MSSLVTRELAIECHSAAVARMMRLINDLDSRALWNSLVVVEPDTFFAIGGGWPGQVQQQAIRRLTSLYTRQFEACLVPLPQERSRRRCIRYAPTPLEPEES